MAPTKPGRRISSVLWLGLMVRGIVFADQRPLRRLTKQPQLG